MCAGLVRGLATVSRRVYYFGTEVDLSHSPSDARRRIAAKTTRQSVSQFLCGPPALTTPPSHRTAPLPSVNTSTVRAYLLGRERSRPVLVGPRREQLVGRDARSIGLSAGRGVMDEKLSGILLSGLHVAKTLN